MKRAWYLFCFFCCFFAAKNNACAQIIFDCVDTTRINDYYLCGNPIYQPVCGCNGVTYRNECAAYYRGGVNYWTNGTCGNFGFDILSNPVLNDVTLSVYTRASERVLVEIWSNIGPKVYTNTFINTQETVQQFFIPTDAFEVGTYTLIMVVNGEFQAAKFVKVARE